MRPISAISAALLAVWLCACGGSSTSSSATTRADPHSASSATTSAQKPPAVPPAALDATVDADKDNDLGAADDDTNNNLQLDFGHAASPAEQRAIATLVKRYYRAGLAENGSLGCKLIYSTLAEAAPEDDGREADAPVFSHGATSCAEVLTDEFRYFHAQLRAELPKLVVTRVRLEEHHGFAYLSFGKKLPERRISVQREGNVWKLNQIYDEELQ